jgi:hypothetical protein
MDHLKKNIAPLVDDTIHYLQGIKQHMDDDMEYLQTTQISANSRYLKEQI